jgi:hypothetical protein
MAFEKTRKITKYTNIKRNIIKPSKMPPSLVVDMSSIPSLR